MWQDIIHFWFTECSPKQWFGKNEDFDVKLKGRFEEAYWRIVRGETEEWRAEPQGRLAEIIVLDQFARNMFRGTPQAFLYDPLALVLAQEAIRAGEAAELTPQERHFLYMPYMHSESPKIHQTALKLFESLGNSQALKYELDHKAIIDRFGRYPHRNAILGRTSTAEEEDFIQTHPGLLNRVLTQLTTATTSVIFDFIVPSFHGYQTKGAAVNLKICDVLASTEPVPIIHNDRDNPLTVEQIEAMFPEHQFKAHECVEGGICRIWARSNIQDQWWVNFTSIPGMPLQVLAGDPPPGNMTVEDHRDACRKYSAARMDLSTLINAWLTEKVTL